jgi:hypothetical protein
MLQSIAVCRPRHLALWIALFLQGSAHVADNEPQTDPSSADVTVEILEGIPDKRSWDFVAPEPTERLATPAFGFIAVPKKWSGKAILIDRTNPYMLRATAKLSLPQGNYQFLLRSRNAARVFIDDDLITETPFIKANANGHEAVPDAPIVTDESLRMLPVGDQEKRASATLDGRLHEFRVEAFIGGQKLRQELGELLLAVASDGQPFRLLSSTAAIPLTDEGWSSFLASSLERLRDLDACNRRAAGAREAEYWNGRHELARQDWQSRPPIEIPPVSDDSGATNPIDRFISNQLERNGIRPLPLADDVAFVRRVTLDTVGVIPTRAEIEAFQADRESAGRAHWIDRLLADSRWADHWVGYWQDVLAENPGILKPTLNNTGPFRWWIHQAFLDNMPVDRFVTEALMMEGSAMGGAPAGFAMATLNDAPMAAKAHVAAKAFLGIELQCARCHDAPFHPFKQQELFNLAAMLGKESQKVPATSSVPKSERARRPLVQVTLEPGATVDAAWPFTDLAPDEFPQGMLRESGNSRERLAALVTSPRNLRFAEVMVNRLWKRYLGLGLVEPVDDWANAQPSHPELLEFLARELITHDYDLKHIARLILNSDTYQRAVRPSDNDAENPAKRSFASAAPRRMTAEQLVDSLFLAAGKQFHSEELCLDVDGRRPITEFLNLGTPSRAWELTSLSNERDRPALALPVAQSIVDLLTAYGWRESRQNPITGRDEAPTPLQALVLANGVVGHRITRLSDDSSITALCLEDRPLADLVRAVFLQILSRPPTQAEQRDFIGLLADGFNDRRVAARRTTSKRGPTLAAAVSWSNHLSPEATRLKIEQERAVRAGDPPTDRLQSDWRERMEDGLWALVNSPEFLFIP